MSTKIFEDVLDSIITLMNDENIFKGPMNEGNSITVNWAGGGQISSDLNKNIKFNALFIIRAKDEILSTALSKLNDVVDSLTKLKTYPSTNEFQIINISSINMPQYTTRDEKNYWICNTSLSVVFYSKKGE